MHTHIRTHAHTHTHTRTHTHIHTHNINLLVMLLQKESCVAVLVTRPGLVGEQRMVRTEKLSPSTAGPVTSIVISCTVELQRNRVCNKKNKKYVRHTLSVLEKLLWHSHGWPPKMIGHQQMIMYVQQGMLVLQ